eukprot:GEMP01028361.1.p1 GENE.GEMP01028361.1~~GEMP01028361.1.p1  ORF type:complete len:462 (+),score=149.81 GEMP01028361.1:250-1635(+)
MTSKMDPPAEAAEKLERPLMPNKQAYEEKSADIFANINKLKAKRAELHKEIKAKKTESPEQKKTWSMLRTAFQEHVDTMSELTKQMQQLKAELKQATAKEQAQRRELYKMRNACLAKSTEEIDRRIKSIEFQLWTSSLSLSAEKRELQDIALLKRCRPKVAQLEQLERNHFNVNAWQATKEALFLVRSKLEHVWNEKQGVKDEMNALNVQKAEDAKDVKPLEHEVQDINWEIDELYQAGWDAREAFRAEERVYRDQQNEIRRAAEEKRRAEVEKRREEFERQKKVKMMEKLMEQPHVAEKQLLEQTLNFCISLLPKTEKEEKKEVGLKLSSPEEGLVMLPKKTDREEDFFSAPAKQKGLRKKGKQRRLPDSIKHNGETFKLFHALRISAPVTLTELPATIERLEKDLVEYNVKIKIWEAKRDAGTLLKDFRGKRKHSIRDSARGSIGQDENRAEIDANPQE